MGTRTSVSGVACALASLVIAVSAVAEDVAAPGTQPAASAPAATAAPSTAAEPAAAASMAKAKADENELICKRVAVTGSRIKKVDACRTQAQWDEVERKAKDYMRRIERSTGNQPGGDSLPSGG